MGVEIIDNFLGPEKFKNLQNTVLDVNFPWYAYTGVTEIDSIQKDHWSFFHLFYQDFEANSPFFKSIADILDELGVKGLIRSKANLYPRSNEIVEHDFHYDYEYSHKSGLYSLNTNNGFTMMEDGEKINSVANRMVLFDASKLHKSTTCSDENYRVNIVLNYF